MKRRPGISWKALSGCLLVRRGRPGNQRVYLPQTPVSCGVGVEGVFFLFMVLGVLVDKADDSIPAVPDITARGLPESPVEWR